MAQPQTFPHVEDEPIRQSRSQTFMYSIPEGSDATG